MSRNNSTGIWRRLGFFALVVCLFLPLYGGWCERYKDRSERNERMRHYYDSVLRAERMYKDSVSRALRQKERDSLQRR